MWKAALTQQFWTSIVQLLQAAIQSTTIPVHVQADPPDPLKLPPDDILGVTVLFLSCSYQGKVHFTLTAPLP